MQERVVTDRQGERKAFLLAAFTNAAFLTAALLLSTLINLWTPPAQAQTQVYLEQLDSMKRAAAGYKGSVELQKRIGDIYLRRFEPNYYQGQIHPSTELNSVEAYVWYALVVARSHHDFMLRDARLADPTIPEETFSGDQQAAINAAKTAFDRMKGQRAFSKGAAGWAAERLFVEQYEDRFAEPYYLLGIMYGTGQYVLRQSYYEAYVYMRVAEMHGFPDAAQKSAAYKKYITFSQHETAESRARELFGSNFGSGGYAAGGTYVGGGSSGSVRAGSAISSGPGWGPDFQTNRRHADAGSSGGAVPPGVDAHHLATSHFDQGNSHLAAGRVEDAKAAYEAAINAEPTSVAAFNASRQLQALTLTCSLRDDRIRRMVRPENRDRVDEGISWERVQLALKALGHYPEAVDGKPDLKTRRAIRSFQRSDLNVDETGYLTTDQRVELVCAAAQDVRDADSQVQLGVMYARGIGLNCNTAAAHGWFQRAADQGHPTALYNLGLMYMQGFYDRQAPGNYPPGTRAYMSNPTGQGSVSIRPRKIRDMEMARYFFEEAKSQGHPDAAKRVSEIKSGKAKKLLREESIVGCIDYEAEIDIAQIGTEAEDLDLRASAIIGQIDNSGGNPPVSACKAIKKLSSERNELGKRTDDYFSYLSHFYKKPQYDREIGQSNEDRIGSAFDKTKALLDDMKGRLASAQKTCDGK